MMADIAEVRLKPQSQKEAPRMVVPSVRVKCKAPGAFVYEPLESSAAEFLVIFCNQNIRSLNKIQANEPAAYFEVEVKQCK